MDTQAPLIAVHKAKYFADKDEKLSLGPGGFVQGNLHTQPINGQCDDLVFHSLPFIQLLNMPLAQQPPWLESRPRASSNSL
jgi:hypothetical protein